MQGPFYFCQYIDISISISNYFSIWKIWSISFCKHTESKRHGPLTRYVKLRVAHAPGIPGTFTQPPQVNDSYMHHGTCVMHVSWFCSLTSGFLWSWWRSKRSRHPGAWAIRSFAYLVRGSFQSMPSPIVNTSCSLHRRYAPRLPENRFTDADNISQCWITE